VPVDARKPKRTRFERFPLPEASVIHPTKFMSAKSEVPVFYRDQDELSESPCRVDSREECRRLKKAGLGYFISHGRAFRLFGESPKIATTPPPSGTTQASTITYDEVRANVGITEETERYPTRAIRRAQAKIRVYPFIGDVRAPLARAYS